MYGPKIGCKSSEIATSTTCGLTDSEKRNVNVNKKNLVNIQTKEKNKFMY